MMMVRRWLTALLTAAIIAVGTGARSDNAAVSTAKPFSSDQIEQLVAPIALYPDSLVAQILMAATYPLEIVQAARWVKDNPDLKDSDLEQALAPESWDPSVKALTNFPDVLQRMADDLDWTQDLGDAVLANQQEVMDEIQKMRRYAKESGNLKTTEEQKVVVQEKVIVIEPATEVVYVPAYNPVVVYGSYWRPVSFYYPIYRYPPAYWYPPGYAASNIISFGVGMAVGAAIWRNWNWGHCNWRGGKVEINNNFNFNRNINTGNINIGNKVGGGKFSNWEHNSKNRRGVRYRDESTRTKFSGRTRDAGDRARIDRDAARGFDRSKKGAQNRPASREAGRDRLSTRDLESSLGKAKDRAAQRDRAPAVRDRQSSRDLQGSGGKVKDRAAPGDRGAKSRDRAGSAGSQPRHADRGQRKSSAFQSKGNGGFERAASARGGQSRASSHNRGGGGARAGGGGHRGGGRR